MVDAINLFLEQDDVPPHPIALIVEGGAAAQLAQAPALPVVDAIGLVAGGQVKRGRNNVRGSIRAHDHAKNMRLAKELKRKKATKILSCWEKELRASVQDVAVVARYVCVYLLRGYAM